MRNSQSQCNCVWIVFDKSYQDKREGTILHSNFELQGHLPQLISDNRHVQCWSDHSDLTKTYELLLWPHSISLPLLATHPNSLSLSTSSSIGSLQRALHHASNSQWAADFDLVNFSIDCTDIPFLAVFDCLHHPLFNHKSLHLIVACPIIRCSSAPSFLLPPLLHV